MSSVAFGTPLIDAPFSGEEVLQACVALMPMTSMSVLLSKSAKHRDCEAREQVVHALRELTSLKFWEIGNLLKKNVTTVIGQHKRYMNRMPPTTREYWTNQVADKIRETRKEQDHARPS